MLRLPPRFLRAAFALLTGSALGMTGHAQSSCSSDGMAPPAALFERFVRADCTDCWADAATPAPGPSALVLDWIVPAPAGDEAALSAAALPEAQWRLDALKRPTPERTDVFTAPVAPAARAAHDAPAAPAKGGRLRVAHGLPINDYIGTGIRWTPPSAGGRFHYRLLLLEALPAGAEGSPIARTLVRNVLEGELTLPAQARPRAWQELRPMRIAEGAKVERLRVAGWVEDAQGNVIAAAQAACQ